MKIAVVFACFFLAGIKCMGQEYNYYHYDVKDGLAGVTVYSIAQDKDGFLWFATETGLSRFDGTRFKNYSVNEGLSSNDIINLFVDSKNRIWVFPFKSEIYYYYKGEIHNNNNDSLLRAFKLKDEIYKALEDKEGNIIFLEQSQIHILSSDNKLKEISRIHNYAFDVNGAGIDSDGLCNFYLSVKYDIRGRNDSLFYIYKYKNLRLNVHEIMFDTSFKRNGLELNSTYSVIKNGNYFQIYSHSKRRYFQIKAPEDFHTLSYISDSTFIVSTFHKTFLYNINSSSIVDSFLTNIRVNRCFKDKEGNFWFATATQGVYQLASVKVKVFRFDDKFNILPVYALNKYENQLYIGCSNNNLWVMNTQNGTIQKHNVEKFNTINRISKIEELNKILYVASNSGFLKVKSKTVSIFLKELAIKDFVISDSSIIVAGSRAVLEFPLYSNNENEFIYDTLWFGRANCISKINGKYYLGTLKSLYLIDEKNKGIVVDMGKAYPDLNDKIISINSVTGTDAWVATESNGLFYIKDDKVVYHLTSNDGLASNACHCIYVSENELWLGTDKGINKIDISRLPYSIQRFAFPESVNSEIINCIYAAGDSIWVGTSFGLYLFNNKKIQTQSICNLALLNIQSNEANWFFKSDSIHLSSNDNFLKFEYAGISFVSSGDITYYYQLKGLSDEWQSTKQNTVEFQSLYPGDYVFNIYAVNKYGVKSKTVTVAFTKAKHFWQLLWVQAIFLGIVAALVWLIIKTRVKAITKKAKENLLREKKINELEQMALRAQMNPHFIFNSLNSIQQYLFSGDVTEANEFITNFSLLVRQTLYMSGKRFISLAEEISYLQSYLDVERTKYEQCFNFRVVIQDGLDDSILVPPLLIQPFVENSIRHGVLNLKEREGKILVHFFEKEATLFCVVEDNGIGRKKAMELKKNTSVQHESKGMALVKSRIESLNNIYGAGISFSIEDIADENTTGTIVTIKLPLHYDEIN